ncbi:MAG TPA: helix-turn-helix transcriptional regulator [Candidatus Dormibacteraeota bacterium]|nr:helix-turn-helix transcriptional regulator [Candidatus Dormibacteraeota bacterium]
MTPGQRPNRRLRLQRRLRGWSQEDVAAGLHRLAAGLGEPEPGVDATMVSRWERGMRRPRPRYVRLLCRLFELPAEQLGVIDHHGPPLAPDRAWEAPEGDVERRDFIRRVGMLLGVAALPAPIFKPAGPEPWERLQRALRQPGGVDEETVAHLERITLALESLTPTQVGSRVILGPITGHLDAITLLLRGSLPANLRRRLCSLAGETAGFAGWLRWNMDDLDGAAAYFRSGLEAAREAADRPLAAYLLGSAACRPPYREDPGERVRLLRARAGWFSHADATAATRVWLAAKEADAYALMGEAGPCLRALDRAEQGLEAARAEPADVRRPRFTVVDRTWLQGERGASLAKLGRTEEARAILQPVIASLGPTSEQDRLWLCTALADTYARDGEPEEACRVARVTLGRAATIQLRPVLRVIQGLQGALRPYASTPAVRDLAEQLHAVGM